MYSKKSNELTILSYQLKLYSMSVVKKSKKNKIKTLNQLIANKKHEVKVLTEYNILMFENHPLLSQNQLSWEY
jgi:hypothetical protein